MCSLSINVCNKHHGATGEYIGRGSPLGNPYPITRYNNRTSVISQYETYINNKIIQRDPEIITELNRLAIKLMETGTLNLVCFCAPQPCHGDIIKSIIFNQVEKYLRTSSK